MSYEPRGKMIDLVRVMRAEPNRLFKVEEVAQVLGCKPYPSNIQNYTQAAITSGTIFRRTAAGGWLYKASPITNDDLISAGFLPSADSLGTRLMPSPAYTEEQRRAASTDVRAPKVEPGWSPPKMIAPRAGSDVRAPKFSGGAGVAALARAEQSEVASTDSASATPGLELVKQSEELDRAIREGKDRINSGKRTTSAATASGHEIPDVRSTPASADAAGAGQEQHESEHRHPAESPEGPGAVANEGDARAASGGSAHEHPEEADFDAALWLDGDLVIYGAVELEDGGMLIAKDHLAQLKRLITWSALS